MKKVLIITYYWPPSGGGGVQRWLKFAKYLPDFGWKPTIFTPQNPAFELKDTTLFKDVSDDLEVIKFPILEPFAIYRKLFKKTAKSNLKQGIVIEKSKLSLSDKLMIWIRANLFIPDPRKFWVKPSLKFLNNFLLDNDIQYIVTTGPPHSMHLIGLGLKKLHPNFKWIADFRDPWSDWDILEKLKVFNWGMRIHRRLESKVMRSCDVLLTISKRLAKVFEEKNHTTPVAVITNGVDESDFEITHKMADVNKFRIAHIGLLNEIRDPKYFWVALEELCQEYKDFNQDLEIVLAGMVSSSILTNLENNSILKSKLNFVNYVSHEKVFEYYASSSLLLLFLNQTDNAKWILPGKFYEYMFSGKPVLCLGAKNSDINDIIKETKCGELVEFDDKENMKVQILAAYSNYQKGITLSKNNEVKKYTRKNLTNKLSQLLNNLTLYDT